METSQDQLLDGSLRLIQPSAGYRVGFDPLLLSAFAPNLYRGARVADLGCGTGAVFLSLLCRQPGLEITAVERAEAFYNLAVANTELNNHKTVTLLQSDIRDLPNVLAPGTFDLVLANPPFYPKGSGRLSSNSMKAQANHERHGKLSDWIETADYLTGKGGTFCLIHLAERHEECLTLINKHFPSIEWLWIKPKMDAPANRVMVRATKGIALACDQLPDLIVHEKGGELTDEAARMINGCESLGLIRE